MQDFTLHPDDEAVLHTKFRSAVAWALWEELRRGGQQAWMAVAAPDPDLELLVRHPESLDSQLRTLLANPERPVPKRSPRPTDVRSARSVYVVSGNWAYDVRGRLPRHHLNMYATSMHNPPWEDAPPVEMSTRMVNPEMVRRRLWTSRDDLALPLARLMADRLLERENPWPHFT